MATKRWSAAEAKARFSELVDAALAGEPQIITRRGDDAVVVMAAGTYRRRGGTMSAFFSRSPHRDVELAPKRDRASGRDIDL